MGDGGVRIPAVAGRFYPGNPGRLADTVDRLLDEAPSPVLEGEVVGLIAPHAGYPYSGLTAAAAYRAIAGGTWQRVVVLAPSHRECFQFASVLAQSYQTPLGVIPRDPDFVRRLVELDPVFQLSEAGHRSEHSLEVQLPFLQRVAPQASLIPIVLSESPVEMLERIGLALAKAIAERPALLVASSDLYHGEDDQECRRTDLRTREWILRADPARFAEALRRGEVQACGAGPIGALLVAARALGADRAQLLAATNSNDVTGNTGGYVVGYAAIALERGNGGRERSEAPHHEEGALRAPLSPSQGSGEGSLTGAERRELLRIARAALERAVLEAPPPDVRHVPPALSRPRAAFVTLHRQGQLRGCIGFTDARHPLARAIVELAGAAALEDPRFRPVEPEELPQISIEISVLTEPVPVRSPEEIEAGRDGVIVNRGRFRGLLLPQVAEEQGWDRRTLLEHCCMKAGLPGNAWRDPETQILRFQAVVFGDEEGGPAAPGGPGEGPPGQPL